MFQERSSSESSSANPFKHRRSARATAAASIAALWLWPLGALASALLAPAVGVPDTALGGTAVALPPTPEGAMFQNPAALVAFPTTTYSAGVGLGFGKGCVEAPGPNGYEECNRPMPLVPSAGLSFALGDRARAALGLFGSTGAAFDYEADPPDVEHGYFSETAVVTLPLAFAYRVRDDLWVGAELSPLFGYLRNRFPLPEPPSGELARVKYTLTGPGVQGMLGLTWLPTEVLSLGLGVRTPGAIWLDGNTDYAGAGRDVDLVIQMPTQIFVGVTARPTPRSSFSASMRWTDASRFGDSDIEFAGLELPFVPDAQDEWRAGLGADFRATDDLTLRGGLSYGTAIVGSEGASPLLFDSEDVKISVGASYALGAWTIHLAGGYQFEEEREITPDEALILPGRYSNSGGIIFLGVVYQR